MIYSWIFIHLQEGNLMLHLSIINKENFKRKMDAKRE